MAFQARLEGEQGNFQLNPRFSLSWKMAEVESPWQPVLYKSCTRQVWIILIELNLGWNRLWTELFPLANIHLWVMVYNVFPKYFTFVLQTKPIRCYVFFNPKCAQTCGFIKDKLCMHLLWLRYSVGQKSKVPVLYTGELWSSMNHVLNHVVMSKMFNSS